MSGPVSVAQTGNTDEGLEVATPERVSVSLPVAGLGYRMMAYLVDAGVLFAVGLVLVFVYSLINRDMLASFQSLGGVGQAVLGLVGFVIVWGYWTVSEVLLRGQTLGKRLVGIRVVKLDGSPVGVFESAVRNLLRVVDFLPACYPVGLVAMMIDKHHRRIGDLLAGTLLVREEKVSLARYETVQAGALSTGDIEVLTSFLQRFDSLEPAARLAVGRQLMTKFGGDPTADEATLRSWLSAKAKGA